MGYLLTYSSWLAVNESDNSLLKLGSTGEEVKAVQKKLGLPETGIYDDSTREAVRRFQADSNNKDALGNPLIQDGIVGPRTREAMFGSNTSSVSGSSRPTDSNSTEPFSIILMGGLDYRAGDYKIDGQVEILKRGLGETASVVGYRYTDLTGVLQAIASNPNAKVVLFSAGGSYSRKIAQAMQNKNNLYIVEPYVTSSAVKRSVQDAVELGVPPTNVVVGPNSSRGAGAVDGATFTPSGQGHWSALEFVGTII